MKTPSAMRAAAVVAAVAASVLSPSLAEMPDSLVEYVEATGTQYIDTGITGRHGTRVDMKFVVTTQKESWMMGSRSTSSSRDRIFPCYLYGTSIDIGYGSSYNRTWWTYSVGATYMLQTDFTDEGVVKATRNGSAANDKLSDEVVDNGFPMYVFACNVGGVATRPAEAKLYYLKIWQTDADGAYRLMRDYVPCVKGGRGGLYDRVSKTIFFSKSSSDFAFGGKTLAVAGLPDSLLAYVESTGAQYVDTGVDARSGTKASMLVNWTDLSEEEKRRLVFLGANNAGSMFYLYHHGPHNDDSTWSDAWWTYYGMRYQSLVQRLVTGKDYLITAEVTADGVFNGIVNGKAYSRDYSLANPGGNSGTMVGPLDINTSLYAFAGNNGGVPAYYTSLRCHSLRMWQTDDAGDYELVRDYRPCMKGGKAGLYDRTSGMVFFSHGADDFVPGPVKKVNPDKFLSFVESTGSQYVDTGIVGRDGTRADMTIMWREVAETTSAGVCVLATYGNSQMFYLLRYLNSGGYNNYFSGYNGRWGNWNEGPVVDVLTRIEAQVEATGFNHLIKDGGGRHHWNYTGNAPVNTETFMYFFARNGNGTADCFSKVRCYSAKIWQDDALVRNYLPCKIDDVPGLFDLVSGDFSPSPSETPLIAGEEVPAPILWRDAMGDRALENASNWLAGCLPESGANAEVFTGGGVEIALAAARTFGDLAVSGGGVAAFNGAPLTISGNLTAEAGTSVSVSNLVFNGAANAVTITGGISGGGVIRSLTMAEGAKVVPDCAACVAVTDALSGKMVIDLSGIDLRTCPARLPLFRVSPAVEAAGVEFVLTAPTSWSLDKTDDADGNVLYSLARHSGTALILR